MAPAKLSDADIGIAGGKDEALLYIRGEKVRMLKGDIVGQLLDEIHKMSNHMLGLLCGGGFKEYEVHD